MVCNKIPNDRIIKGFRKLGAFKNLDGSENNILWKQNKTPVIQSEAPMMKSLMSKLQVKIWIKLFYKICMEKAVFTHWYIILLLWIVYLKWWTISLL